MKSDGDVNVPVLNGWNTNTYRVEMLHLRDRIAMSTDWFTVLSTSQYIPLDGALVHDMSVCTFRLMSVCTVRQMSVCTVCLMSVCTVRQMSECTVCLMSVCTVRQMSVCTVCLMSVCTIRLIPAHAKICMCLNYDFISSLSFYIWQ